MTRRHSQRTGCSPAEDIEDAKQIGMLTLLMATEIESREADIANSKLFRGLSNVSNDHVPPSTKRASALWNG